MAIDLGEITGSTASRTKKKETTQIANGLDKDAFMKLFLEQLKNQDPTSPMETDKIITQTAQLTQVEMQEENKKTMKEVAQAMKASQETNKSLQDFQKDMKKSLEMLNMGMEENTNATTQGTRANNLNAVSMIGKIAETDIMGLNVNGSGENHFSLYFDNKIDASKGSPVIEILSPTNEMVKTISLRDKDGQQGYLNFSWDGKDSKGNIVPPGSYQVKAHYNLDPQTKQYDETRIGRGEVQSIVYDKGIPLMRLGDNILPVQSALEFYPKGENANKSLEAIKADANKAMNAYKDDFKTESLSDRYNKIVKEREAKIAKEEYKDEDTIAADEKAKKDAQKAQEMKKYEKMLDVAEKGKQLDQAQLDKLSKMAAKTNDFKKDSLQAELEANAHNKNVKPLSNMTTTNPLDSKIESKKDSKPNMVNPLQANMPKNTQIHANMPTTHTNTTNSAYNTNLDNPLAKALQHANAIPNTQPKTLNMNA